MQWAEALKSVYKSVEHVDFVVGCLAESPRPKGYVISDVQFYVFIISASRRLLCDRFYQVGHMTMAVSMLWLYLTLSAVKLVRFQGKLQYMYQAHNLPKRDYSANDISWISTVGVLTNPCYWLFHLPFAVLHTFRRPTMQTLTPRKG